MRVGTLRRKLYLQRSTDVQDTGTGGVTRTWSVYRTCHGKVEFTGGGELIRAGKIQRLSNVTITIRRSPENRVIGGDRVLVVESQASLNGAINASVTAVTVNKASLTVAPGDALKCETELMKVSSGHGTTSLTVVRDEFDTVAATHANGVTIERVAVLEVESVGDIDGARREITVGCRELE